MFVELHLIQSFAPACLNRDDTNTPKSCEFGGFRRARISSQCIKRAIRTYFVQHADELSLSGRLGSRSKELLKQLVQLALKDGVSTDEAGPLLKFAMESAGLKMDDERTSVLLFLGSSEIEALYHALRACWSELAAARMQSMEKADAAKKPADSTPPTGGKSPKEQRRERKESIPEAARRAFDVLKQGARAADIALFGRMVAEIEHMNVNAACQVAHAISTNEVDMEMDFFTAVDDLQAVGKSGAGMLGVAEFNSSCYYRYALLDTKQLFDGNLPGDRALARAAAAAFIKASIFAIPSGKQNSMAAQNLPVYVRIVARDAGAPMSLANAFLSPVLPDRNVDLALASIRKLETYENNLTRMYGTAGIRLDAASSVYQEHGSLSVQELLGQAAEVFA